VILLSAGVSGAEAEVMKHLPDDVFRHPAGEVGIHDPHHRNVWKPWQAKDVVDPGAKGKDHPQVGQEIEGFLQRFPGQNVMDAGEFFRGAV
jgi:hypothetical protein